MTTYSVVIDYDPRERVYNVSVPALPGCFAWGKTKAQAIGRAKEVIRTFLDALADLGEPIPQGIDIQRI